MLFNAGLSPAVKRLDLAQAAVVQAEDLCDRFAWYCSMGECRIREWPP